MVASETVRLNSDYDRYNNPVFLPKLGYTVSSKVASPLFPKLTTSRKKLLLPFCSIASIQLV